MRHTSGPYEVLYDEHGPYRIVGSIKPDGSRFVIADIASCDTAHAVLLAAAPVMLEACKQTLDIVNSYSHIPALFQACEILQAAIAKAEGKK